VKEDFEAEIVKIRREIHENPELSYREVETSALVTRKLRDLGIQVKTNVGKTGVIGLLEGDTPGNVVGLRADMDALPINEEVDLPFKSKNSQVMHACGHDSHVAMLLGAAMLLSRHKEQLSGTVKLLFQPAEEAGEVGGAKLMIQDGAMENPKINYIFGIHVRSVTPSATFCTKPGPVMAAPDTFTIKIFGKSGHGSRPHETVDPIYISAQVINALQGISGRMVDQTRPFVISVGSIHSGTKENIIPDDAEMRGTIRTLDEQTRSLALRKVRGVVDDICRAFGGRCEISFEKDPYPITFNDEMTTEAAVRILKGIEGTKTIGMEPVLGAEDFSRFLQKAPGTFYFLGTRNPKKGCVYPTHSSKFKLDEDVMKYGAVSHAMMALEFGRRR
jgi:carboxypeptidase Ss1